MAAVAADEDSSGLVSGIVASLSDVTRQHELQQTKNDVIALVSHEMRTPLTAIQGMTELLANYEMDPARRKEISSAINGEVKRLTGMITEYLDITRLESGATTLRKTPVKVEALLQRIVLLLEPVAAQRGIRLSLDALARTARGVRRRRPAGPRGGEPGLQRHQVQPGGHRSDRFSAERIPGRHRHFGRRPGLRHS